MKRLAVMVCIFALAASGAAQSQAPQKTDPFSQDCATIAACVRVVAENGIEPAPAPTARVEPGMNTTPIMLAIERLSGFGEAGVVAVLPLLDDPNPYVRRRVGYVLEAFPSIDPKHLPRLLAARAAGVRNLEGAIGRTGTDEALALLWANYQATGNGLGLTHFGARLDPLLRPEIERCRAARQGCDRLAWLLRQLGELPPFAIDYLQGVAESPTASEGERSAAVEELIRRRHPYALGVLMTRLKAHAALAEANREPQGPVARYVRSNVELLRTISQLGTFGPAAVEAGPILVRFLGAKGLPDERERAALAIGLIGYREGAAALLAQQGDFEDDWLIAYNVAESLGRLGAGEAVLRALARDHWYQPVRNNAARALNFMATQRFVLPDVAWDRPQGSDWLGIEARYAADLTVDMTTEPATCRTKLRQDYGLFMPRMTWPSREVGPVALRIEEPTAAQIAPLLAGYPALTLPRNNPPVFAVPLGGAWIVGTDAGEFGGGVQVLGPGGEVRTLIGANAVAAFPIDGGLLIATGLAHMFATGDLWIVGLDKDGAPQVRRRIRLPSNPRAFKVVWPQTLVVMAAGEEFGVTSAGKLVHISQVEGCRR